MTSLTLFNSPSRPPFHGMFTPLILAGAIVLASIVAPQKPLPLTGTTGSDQTTLSR